MVCLLPVGIFKPIMLSWFICFFQFKWHACELARCSLMWLNVKFNKVSRHELSACLASGHSHKCRLTWNIAARCLCFSAGLELAFQQPWAVWSRCFQIPPSHPYYSSFHWCNQCWPVPGMGAHGWVAGICQPWWLYFIWGLAGHSGGP